MLAKSFLLTVIVALSASTSFAEQVYSEVQVGALTLEQALDQYTKSFCKVRPGCSAAEFVKQHKSLKLQEADALRRYTSGEYEQINQTLRDDKLTRSQVSFVRVLDSAISKLPRVSNIVVYRGTTTEFNAMKESETITLPNYLSTTVDQTVAEDNFMKDRLMIINIKNGYDVSSVSSAGQEREILLPRNTSLYVNSIEKENKEVIDMEAMERKQVLVEVVNLIQK